MLTLAQLSPGCAASVAGVRADRALCNRLAALGLRPGQVLVLLRQAPWLGPLHLRVGTTELMLRRRDAACIDIAAVTPLAADVCAHQVLVGAVE